MAWTQPFADGAERRWTAPPFRAAALAVLVPIGGCGGGHQPLQPTEAPVQAALPASANAAPTILGDEVCISPLNVDHVFALELRDPDGDSIRWTAVKESPQGTLSQEEGGPVPAGTTITLVYSPPRDRPDENWILVTATDTSGATATLRLYVKND